jgi:outer membrane protein OmpU
MKKILMSTSALVAAGLMLAPGDSLAKVKIGVGGFFSTTMGVSDNENDFEVDPAGGTGQAERDSFNMVQDSEIYFRGNTKLDNGTRVDVIIQLETDQANATDIDESYVRFTGAFGDIRIGSTSSATTVLRNTARYTGPYRLDTPDLNNFIRVPGDVTVVNGNTHALAGNDREKVVYISPIMNGLRFGASWLPDNAAGNQAPIVGGNGAGLQAWDIGIQYGNKTFKADLATGEFVGQASSGGKWIRGGVNATFGATSIGASMMNRDNNKGALRDTTDSDEGESIDVGIQHKMGAYTVGISYFNSSAQLAAAGDDEETSMSLGASTAIGPGVTGSVGVYSVSHSDVTAAAGSNNDGWALIGQVRVAF